MLKNIGTTKTHLVQQIIFGKDGSGPTKYQLVPLDENGCAIYNAKLVQRFDTLKEADEIAGLTKPAKRRLRNG